MTPLLLVQTFCISYFSHRCDKMPNRDNLVEEGFNFVHSFSPWEQGKHGVECLWKMVIVENDRSSQGCLSRKQKIELIDPLLLGQPHLSKVLQPSPKQYSQLETKNSSIWIHGNTSYSTQGTKPLQAVGGMCLKFQSLYSHREDP